MQPDYGLYIEIYERPDLGRGVSSRSTSHLTYKKPSVAQVRVLPSGHWGVLAGLGE